LELLRQLVATTEIPRSQFLPTHLNRSERLFLEGIAYAKEGGFIDLTCSDPAYLEAGDVKAATGLRRCLEAGVSPQHITFTSDGQGSLPIFNENRECVRLGIGQISALFAEVRDAVQQEGVELVTALGVVTRNPAELYKLKGKGRLLATFDADVVIADRATLAIETVIAKGRILMADGRLRATGTFES
jgi:beta-aspartyl-dipeptidase (metallo-type)